MDSSISAPAAFVMDFIGSLEAPKGYDTVYNNKMKLMPKRLTSMTFDEVVEQGKWRTDTFGSSACGRYQFMRDTLDSSKTLADLKGEMNLSGNEKFTPDLQDRMCLHLLKRRGYDKFIAGKLAVKTFGNNIAKEWASFPVLTSINGKRRGQSYYAGDGKNTSLTTADKLESVLSQALSMAGYQPAGIASLPTGTGPSVESDVAAPSRPSVGGILASLWGKLTPSASQPSLPVLATKGDPVVFTNQKLLKDRGYYLNGFLDGIDGPKYRDAVAAARKDNGLGDGPADAEFAAKLPTFGTRPVGKERSTADFAMVKAHAPDLASPVGTLWKGGLASLVLGGAGQADLGSMLEKYKTVGDQAGDVLGTVQSVIGSLGGVIGFVVSHWQWFLIGFGLYLLARAGSFALTLIIRIRQAFF